MAFDSVEFASYFLKRANLLGKGLNQTQLQKLLFIIYGYYLSKGKLLLVEQPKAWPFGPVFPRVQSKIKPEEKMEEANLEGQDEFDPNLDAIIDQVIKKYGDIPAKTLSEWSHSKGSPWEQTTLENGFNWNAPISTEKINSYFLDKKIID